MHSIVPHYSLHTIVCGYTHDSKYSVSHSVLVDAVWKGGGGSLYTKSIIK